MRTPKVTFTVEKKSGPKTEPWETLQEMATVNSLNTASKGNFLLNHDKYYDKTVPGNLGAVPPPQHWCRAAQLQSHRCHQHNIWTCQISPSLLPLHSSPPPLQVLIPSVKLDYSHVKSRCGSLDRRGYSAGGGNVSLVLPVHCPNVSGCVSVVSRQYFSVFHPALASQFSFLTRWVVSLWGDLI